MVKKTLKKIITYFKYMGSVKFGATIRDSHIAKESRLYADASLISSSLDSYSYVGDRSKISNASIGKFCSIGPDVLVGPGRHPTNFVSTCPIFYSNKGQLPVSFLQQSFYQEHIPIRIGNDVWIGARAIIMDGVDVGDGAVIAGGSVVTQNVAAYEIVGGIPAKHIKYRFDEAVIVSLQAIKWWEKDIDEIQTNLDFFRDVEAFVDEFS